MRKLSNVEKKAETSLEGILRACSCRAACPSWAKENRETYGDNQSEYAYSGTMPEGIEQKF
jgi:hypothetical protein